MSSFTRMGHKSARSERHRSWKVCFSDTRTPAILLFFAFLRGVAVYTYGENTTYCASAVYSVDFSVTKPEELNEHII